MNKNISIQSKYFERGIHYAELRKIWEEHHFKLKLKSPYEIVNTAI